MNAAKNLSVRFDAVADDPAVAVRASDSFPVEGGYENTKATHRLLERKQSDLRDSASSGGSNRTADRPSRACERPASCQGCDGKIGRGAPDDGAAGGPPNRSRKSRESDRQNQFAR